MTITVVEAPLEQIEIIRAFNQKVDHLDRSGFAARYNDAIPNMAMKFDDAKFKHLGGGQLIIEGRISSWLEDFSQDEIDAFVLTLRLFNQDNDRISIHRLSQIYAAGWIPVEAQKCFEEARNEINNFLGSVSILQFGNQHITVGTIVDIVIYGGMAHTNKQKAEIFSSWINGGIQGFIWAEFHAYARKMLDVLRYFRKLNEQILSCITIETE